MPNTGRKFAERTHPSTGRGVGVGPRCPRLLAVLPAHPGVVFAARGGPLVTRAVVVCERRLSVAVKTGRPRSLLRTAPHSVSDSTGGVLVSSPVGTLHAQVGVPERLARWSAAVEPLRPATTHVGHRLSAATLRVDRVRILSSPSWIRTRVEAPRRLQDWPATLMDWYRSSYATDNIRLSGMNIVERLGGQPRPVACRVAELSRLGRMAGRSERVEPFEAVRDGSRVRRGRDDYTTRYSSMFSCRVIASPVISSTIVPRSMA